MTLLSRICFSLAAALALDAAAVSGRVTLDASKEKRVQRKKDFSGVVVWLEPHGSAPPEPAPRTAKMVQKDKTFVPHVLAVPVGSTVDFPNFDPIYHNAFSNYSGQVFDVGLYAPGTSRAVRFRREGIVRVFCNIHPTMSAVIAVLRSPWFAVTSKDGRFEVPDVPAGEYTLRLFHERATEATLRALERRVAVRSSLELPDIGISEAGFIPIPHKNKYGRDYPPVVQDQLPIYGGHK